MNDLEHSVKELKQNTKIKKIYGILGIPINGQRTVEVPNREGFVYVRLRDNQSELIQAINSEVSPVYDLPVVLVREGNRYKIEGRDTERYQTWGSFSSFLPRHGEQHSFLEGNGGGGDITWVDGKQFMPMLVMPSGTLGANNVVISDYRIQDGSSGWIYSGGTGTPNLLMYKPTNGNAVMILVYVDQTTGNPGFLVGSGSYFSNTITGSAQVNPYIPANPNSDYLPAMAVRLSSGTSVIGWDNLYDVRQYYGGGGSASTGSSSGLPTFITGSVPYAGSNGILKEDNSKFSFDETRSTLWIGQKFTPALSLDSFRLFLRATGTNTTVTLGLIAAGTGSSGINSPTINGYRSRGTFDTPLPSGNDDILLSIVGSGFDGFQYSNSAVIRFHANSPFITGTYTESRMAFEVTPSGSNTRIPKMVLYGDSVNLINTGTYNVNGVPHSHDNIETSGWHAVSQTWSYASADDPVYQIYASGDVTSNADYKLGNKIKCTNNSTTVFGFIVKVGAYDGGNNRTPIDLYCGTDYDIANSAITNVFISKIKSPDGFPMSPDKWTVVLNDTSNASQASPTNNTFYNLGTLSVAIPIGVWDVYYSLTASLTVTTTALRSIGIVTALSTSNNSVSDNALRISQQVPGPTGTLTVILLKTRSKIITLTTKTTYYLVGLGSVATDAITTLAFRGDLNTTVVRCICAYL